MELPSLEKIRKLASEQLETLKKNFRDKFTTDSAFLTKNIENGALELEENGCINLDGYIRYYYNSSFYKYDTEFDLELFLIRNRSIFQLKCHDIRGGVGEEYKLCGEVCMKKK